MRIVKKETIYLSSNEMDSFVEVTRFFEGIIRECEDPCTRYSAESVLRLFNSFIENYCEFEED